MKSNLAKRVLLLAPDFFGYYKEIEKNIVSRGWLVDTILENFVNQSYLYRFFYVKNSRAKIIYTNKYYVDRINNLKNTYDYVLVIRGEALTLKLLELLKKRNPNAQFIMYQWDSVRNNRNALLIKDAFERIYTFDIEDAKKYNWIYRPLFYIEEKKDSVEKKTIDFAFIGTLYYKRALLLKKLKKFCEKNGNTEYDYLFTPKLVYYLHRYIMHDKRYSILETSEVQFVPLGSQELVDRYKCSKILVDYTADDQTGLTMRTIESIGYHCKIITNNKKIQETDIYQYGNIYIYDLDNFDIPSDFIESGYKDLPGSVNHYYSLSGWVESIFTDK